MSRIRACMSDDQIRNLGETAVYGEYTVRQLAGMCNLSKSCIYYNLTVILPRLDKTLANCVKEVLLKNKQERSYRGGRATRRKFQRSD